MSAINISHAKEVIKNLGSTFDTHDFIIQLIKEFERDYLKILCRHLFDSHVFMSAHAEVGRYLSSHAKELSIEKVNRKNSDNIKDYPSENQVWRKK